MKTRAPPPPLAPQPAPRHIFRNSVLDGGGPSAIDAKDNTANPYVTFQLTLPQGRQISMTEDGRWGSREVHTSVHSGTQIPVVMLSAFVLLLQSFAHDFSLSLLFNIPFIWIPKYWNLFYDHQNCSFLAVGRHCQASDKQHRSDRRYGCCCPSVPHQKGGGHAQPEHKPCAKSSGSWTANALCP